MAHGSYFKGANKSYRPPEGVSEEQCATLHTFVNGKCIVSCWEFTPEELAEINRTGKAFVSVWSGMTLFPLFIGSESAVHALVADFGAVWPLSEQRSCGLYQYKYISSKGYVVYRAPNEEEHLPTFDLNNWIEWHKTAVFITENEAKDYCNYRNTATLRNGSDAVTG